MVRKCLGALASNSTFQKRYAEELVGLRNPANAAAVLLGLIRAGGKGPVAYKLLAEVEQARGHYLRAALCVEQWLNLEPCNPGAWGRLAAIRHALGQLEVAVEAYERATELAPDEISLWVGLALSAVSAQKLGTAVQARNCLVREFPGSELTHLVDGHIKKVEGSRREAIAAYERALEIAPNLFSAIFNLVDLKTPSLDDPLTMRIRQAAENEVVNDPDKVNLHFSLGRIYEKAQKYDSAFRHYKSGNEATIRVLRARGLSYDPASVEFRAENTVRMYSKDTFQSPVEPLEIDLRLILIVGLPRSGTTLIQQIVGSHSKVLAGGELTVAQNVHLQYLKRREELRLSGAIDPNDRIERELLLEMRELYVDNLFARNLDGEYVIDKLPGNFEHLGFIRLLFPDAVIIHSRRNLLATCWSLYASNFAMHEPYYNSLEHLSHYCNVYRRLMEHWAAVLSPIIEVRYESLIDQPEEVSRRLMAEIGLRWEDKCLRFYDFDNAVMTASGDQVRRPIYSSSVGRWRNYECYLREMRREFGRW